MKGRTFHSTILQSHSFPFSLSLSFLPSHCVCVCNKMVHNMERIGIYPKKAVRELLECLINECLYIYQNFIQVNILYKNYSNTGTF